ncbi:heme biosynthesis HemY N-terminal domain-containing protein [Shewanella waksmanii]|uniref:heme biosynthesis HemY N-terminal domain-containing protein n=1 Tax=Shewanella waksmanii TaxID=213783 RepID=UPI00048BE126|nr:heme biosynthesis HemY N-terminal domain-containing protein [Shewanella waksmanii]
MMRALFYLVVILLGLCVSPYLAGANGYVYLAFADYEIETSLVFAILAAIVFYTLLQLVEWVIVFLVNLLLSSRLLPERWRRKAARKHTLNGALSLAEEDWPAAEKAMAKGAEKGEIPTLNLLVAARAAQHQGNTEQRDNYLLEADKEPTAKKAVATTRMRYLLQQGKLDDARAILDELNPSSKSKSPVLLLALELYQSQQDWHAINLLLPILKKRQLLTDEKWQAIALQTKTAMLNHAIDTNEQELEKVWHWLTRAARKQPQYIAIYARGLAKFDRKPEALKLLLKQAKASVHGDIYAALAELVTAADVDTRQILFALEKKFADNAEYQLCIAQLYLTSKEYRLAKPWLQKACDQNPQSSSWQLLAETCEHLGEQNAAILNYRRALS